MAELVCAVVGAGAISRNLHSKALTNLTNCKLKWVCDSNGEAARKYAEDYQVPYWTDKLEDILNDSEVDWVDIATPNHTHEEVAIRCFESGKHVMCQKPMALTSESGLKMMRAAGRAGRQLGMYMCFRTDPAFELLHRMIAEGCFGQIISYRGKMISGNGYNLKDGQWRMDYASGAMDLLGVHLIDLFFWLHQSDIQAVQAYSNTLYAPMKGDDVTTAIYEFGDGVTAVMETTYSSFVRNDTPLYTYEINGTEGFAHYRMDTGELTLQLKRNYESAQFAYQGGEVLTRTYETYRDSTRVHQDFCNSLLAGVPCDINGEAGLKALTIMEATREAALTQRKIHIARK